MRRLVSLLAALVLAAVVSPQPASAKVGFPDGVASGDVTRRGALLWTRTSGPAHLRAEVAADRRFREVVFSDSVNAAAGRDFTVEVEARSMLPGQEYFYRFLGPAGERSPIGRFRTASGGRDLRFVYSGDSDGTVTAATVTNYRATIASVSKSIRRQRPDFFIYLGDTIYADSALAASPADTLDEYRGRYREVRSIAALRRLLASTSVVAQWDDHEVVNDYAGDTAGTYPPGLSQARIQAGQQAFREYLPVREGPGSVTYRTLRWGKDLELFILDQRSFRTSPLAPFVACDQDPGPAVRPDIAPTLPQTYRSQFAGSTGISYLSGPPPPGCLAALNNPNRTMLGAEQESWLKEALRSSRATFKVIVNEVPIQELYANPYDRWEGYPVERKELLRFIADNGIEGVFFATTDTHATIANVVCPTTFAADGTYICDRGAHPWEVVAGPMGTRNFAAEVNDQFPGAADDVELFIRAFLLAPCVDLDEPGGYATVDVDGRKDRMRIFPRKPGGKPATDICVRGITVRG